MTKQYYAHSKEDKPLVEWQPLKEHLKNVSKMAKVFSEKFQSGEWAENSGFIHDLGKAADKFQAYLLRENGLDDSEYDGVGKGRINHSSAGAAFALDLFGPRLGLIYAYLVSGHHAGLPDYYSSDTGRAALEIRLEEGKINLGDIRSIADEIRELIHCNISLPIYVKQDNFHLWIRMLFSSLVDADYLDTEKFMDNEKADTRGKYPNLLSLKDMFDAHMDNLTGKDKDKPVNIIRNEILSACRYSANNEPGLFSLTVPTGGGKTLSGMAFALDHAVENGKERIIYVIPYTSIIEQTAKILSDIFGAENVIEHHSNLEPEKETQRSRLASENWDAPIIVTTNVQFFESLYASKPGRCRKLHNIVNSVVILDEAQLIPPEFLAPCTSVLNLLTRHYGVTLVLSTATQPALPGLDPPMEIISNKVRFYKQLQRTEIFFPGDWGTPSTWKEIARILKGYEQALCVVNTRRDCHDLFELMPEGTIHLSALMCGAHRSDVIKTIKERLANNLPIHVISTQLVEAGVDIDFPVVYRAFAGLDSITQAGGRCNREGKLNKEGKIGEVHVFLPPKPAPIGLLRKGTDTTRELMAIDDPDIHDPDIFKRYFELFYSKLNDTGSKFKAWLEKDASEVHIHFRTAGKEFKLIEDVSQTVFVAYNGSSTYLEELRRIGPKRQNMRALQRYTVNISNGNFLKMKAEGLVEEVWPGLWLWGGRYDPVSGLDIFGESFDPEDLVV